MKKINFKSILVSALITIFAIVSLTGCVQEKTKTPEKTCESSGVLKITVNPEIEIFYDENGNVTNLKSNNGDGEKILKGYDDYQGKETKTVVLELVDRIGKAGYFTEEIESENNIRKVTLEIEPGSILPSDTFLEDISKNIQKSIDKSNWKSSIDVVDYDLEDYIWTNNENSFKENDDIVVYYDKDGNVTKVISTDDGKITKVYNGFEGKTVSDALLDLIDKIGEKEYFVDEIEAKSHKIEIELENSSKLSKEISYTDINESMKSLVKDVIWDGSDFILNIEAEDILGHDIEIDDSDYDEIDDDKFEYDD